MKSREKYSVLVHGDRKSFYEVSVIADSNTHGRVSWGWCDQKEKILIKGGYVAQEDEWEHILNLANGVCKHMNSRKRKKPTTKS